MRCVRDLVIAGAAVVLSFTAVAAADLPPVQPMYHPPIEEFHGWYLRGDIGMTNQSVKSLNNALYAGNTVVNTGLGFDSSPLFGVGVGYQFNNWLRFDVTGEYRGKANFHGLDIVRPNNGGLRYTDQYTASKSEWVGLLNGYIDLGTWWNFTPFIGGGVGFARNTISGFTDVCMIDPPCLGGSVATGATASKWNFAWAAHAGLAYHVSPAFTVELAYRYLDLGNAQTGDLIAFDGTNNLNNPMYFNHLTSHDVKLGVRWMFGGPSYAPPPLVTKG